MVLFKTTVGRGAYHRGNCFRSPGIIATYGGGYDGGKLHLLASPYCTTPRGRNAPTYSIRNHLNRSRSPLLTLLTRETSFFSTSTKTNETSNENRATAGKGSPPDPSVMDTTTTHFGFENIPTTEKEDRVRHVFDNVADSYDVMNDFMSFGIHRYWKDQLCDLSNVAPIARTLQRKRQSDPSLPPDQYCILDMAGGTGDVAFRFVNASKGLEYSRTNSSSSVPPVSVTICDINREMLQVGEQRARKQYGSAFLDDQPSNEENSSARPALSFVQGNAQDLQPSFGDNTFDLYTIAFGLRNVTDVDRALEEAHRVLKPGGRFMCLEFTHVPDPVFRQIYDLYSFQVIPVLGQMVANDRASYQYLVESIRRFCTQEELVEKLQRAGFTSARYSNWTGGIVALHEGWKPH